MGSRREVIAFASVALVTLVVTACSSASSGGSSSTGFGSASADKPPSGVTGSGGGSTGSTGVPSSPAGCPGTRTDQPVVELTEAVLRDRAVGIYRTCGGGDDGLEVRVDPDTDRLMTYRLDGRFVRDGSEGWLEITSCNARTCTAVWHLDGAMHEVVLMLWTDPVAIDLADRAAFEGSQEWVHVSN